MIGYLIPLAILIFGLGGISFIVIRKIRSGAQAGEGGLVYPDFVDSAERDPVVEPSEYTNAKSGTPNVGAFFIFMEKFLRKMSVRLMKLENWLASVSRHFHEKGLKKRSPSSNDKSTGNGNDTSFISLNGNNGEFDEKYWLDILKQEPKSAYPYKKLGEIYLAREDFREARAVMHCALRMDPTDTDLKLKIESLKGKKTKHATLAQR